MKIYCKNVRGFWFWKQYFLYVAGECGLVEILVDKNVWMRYDIGDFYEIY